jgi:iron complex outermembrane receptor protein
MNVDLDVNWKPGDDWAFHFEVGPHGSERRNRAQPFVEFGAPASFNYDLRGKAPQVHFNTSTRPCPSDMQFIFSSLHEILNEGLGDVRVRDAERKLNGARSTRDQFGAKYTGPRSLPAFQRDDLRRLLTCRSTRCRPPTSRGRRHLRLPRMQVAGPGTLTQYWQVNRNEVEAASVREIFRHWPVAAVLYPQQSFSIRGRRRRRLPHGELQGRAAGVATWACATCAPTNLERLCREPNRVDSESLWQLRPDQRRPHVRQRGFRA